MFGDILILSAIIIVSLAIGDYIWHTFLLKPYRRLRDKKKMSLIDGVIYAICISIVIVIFLYIRND